MGRTDMSCIFLPLFFFFVSLFPFPFLLLFLFFASFPFFSCCFSFFCVCAHLVVQGHEFLFLLPFFFFFFVFADLVVQGHEHVREARHVRGEVPNQHFCSREEEQIQKGEPKNVFSIEASCVQVCVCVSCV